MSKIEPIDHYCGFHPHEFSQKTDAEQIDWQIREIMDKLDEVVAAVNNLVEQL